ncbi:hypothetical protein ACFL96_16110 [Thermoproteota archaeon]
MSESKFSMDEAIRFGWQTTKENIGFFVGILILVGIVNAIPNYWIEIFKEQEAFFMAFIMIVAASCLSAIVQMGVINISLKFCDNEKAEFSDLFSNIHLFLNFIAGSALYGLIVFAGFLLLIVPGVIFAIKFQFFSYLIIDKGLGPIEAIKESGRITDGAKMDLLFFNLVLGCINLMGLLCLFVGLFASIPTTMLAAAFVYRVLLTRSSSFQEPQVIQAA